MSREQTPWRELRSIAPPPGARLRILAAAEAEVAGRRVRWGRVALLAPALAGVAIVLVARLPSRALGIDPGSAPAIAVAPAIDPGSAPGIAVAPAIARPPALAVGATREVEVAQGRRAELAVGRAAVSLEGPARARVGPGELAIEAGVARVDGELTVACPRCRLRVAGRGRIEVRGGRVQVAIYAGRAEPVPPESECEVRLAEERPPATVHERARGPRSRASIAPSPRTTESPIVARAVAPTSAVPPIAARAQPARPDEARAAPIPPPRRWREESRAPSDLSLQVALYRAARALSGIDDHRALARWRDLAARWPSGAFAPEVELEIVNALARLGRRDEALAAARDFVRRRPDSPRAAELRARVEAGER